jgi:hypothetical protein
MREIPLTRGKVALVDDADFEAVSAFKWYAYPHRNTWYAARKNGNATIQMHRFILNTPQGLETDHEDGDGLNNRRYNIRVSTHAQNIANQGPQRGHLLKGVKKCNNCERWIARIGFNHRSLYLGIYQTPEAAAYAYDCKAVELFGEFARCNFAAPAVSP